MTKSAHPVSTASRRRALRVVCVLATLAGAASALGGCILFEDPSAIERVDGGPISTADDTMTIDQMEGDSTVSTMDTSGDADAVGDMDLCSDSNPLSCGSACTDCTAFTAVMDAGCAAGVCVINACTSGFSDT